MSQIAENTIDIMLGHKMNLHDIYDHEGIEDPRLHCLFTAQQG